MNTFTLSHFHTFRIEDIKFGEKRKILLDSSPDTQAQCHPPSAEKMPTSQQQQHFANAKYDEFMSEQYDYFDTQSLEALHMNIDGMLCKIDDISSKDKLLWVDAYTKVQTISQHMIEKNGEKGLWRPAPNVEAYADALKNFLQKDPTEIPRFLQKISQAEAYVNQISQGDFRNEKSKSIQDFFEKTRLYKQAINEAKNTQAKDQSDIADQLLSNL